MGLRVECPQCGLKTIPKRIIGVYVGSADSIKIWECRECKALWSTASIFAGEASASFA